MPYNRQASTGTGTSNFVYVQSAKHGWVPARVVSIQDNQKEVEVEIPLFRDESLIQSTTVGVKKREKAVVKLDDYANRALPLQNVDEDGELREVEDMVDLPFLHEPAILFNLKARHADQKPYTRTGDIVIAVNPYVWLNHLYSEANRIHYSDMLVWKSESRSGVEPHVYETSSLSYRGLAADGQHQSILVSGESGAGKTETVKILMNHLASIQQSTTPEKNPKIQMSPIVQRVLDSNPLLEAFGNAKTVRNDNSSRFGKYLQLQFDTEDPRLAAYAGKKLPSCILAGSKCEVYLLEKSRVIAHEENERAYHIFYQLLAAPDNEKRDIWEELEDCDNESFAYVGYTDLDRIEGKTDGERFGLTKDALAQVGVSGESFRMLMRTICVVLQLGNLTFGPDSSGEGSLITSSEELDLLCKLMGVDEGTMTLALTERTMKARNETFKVPLKDETASDTRDALAKEIYAKTFLWLVRSINDATTAERNYDGDKKSGFGLIGLLDIFGFESFVVNRFEQLCINYANEKLQQKFTQDIFRSVQQEYEEEGIELGEISYEDNSDVLQLVEGRMGLIAVLNEECVRPKGSDTAFVSKVQAMNKESDVLIMEKSFRPYQFGVHHYAGKVVYDANHFVTKNMDTLSVDLLECAKKSSNPIIANELENDAMMNDHSKKPKRKAPAARGGAHRTSHGGGGGGGGGGHRGGSLVQQTVWSKFRSQLTSLMTSLSETRTRYIRCIKPNTLKKPKLMMHDSTIQQLRCAGVVAAVTISRSAFPNRLEHELVVDRFKPLWPKGVDPSDGEKQKSRSDALKKNCGILLTSALKDLEKEKDDGTMTKAFVIGRTRAYFRAGALEYLESERLKGLSNWATVLQRVIRGYVQRSKYKQMRKAATSMEAAARGFVQRKEYLRLRTACIVIQCWARCMAAAKLLVEKRLKRAATMVQTRWRITAARTNLKRNKRAAQVIQAIARGYIQRPKFRVALREKQEEAKLENKLIALQRKLEEAEKARVAAEKKAAEKKTEVQIVYKEAQPAPKAKEEAAPPAPAPEPASVSALAPAPVAEPKKETPTEEPAVAAVGTLTEEQQTLMDESGKMLEYLRKEVFKLRNQNARLRGDFDLLKENNQRLMDANASAGASFGALNQHAKQLNKANAKLTAELGHYKAQIQKIAILHIETKEELKMKQASYIAEVTTRLHYQKTMATIVDTVENRCRDRKLVEEVLDLYDACESTYMDGPTHHRGKKASDNADSVSTDKSDGNHGDANVLSKIKHFFG